MSIPKELDITLSFNKGNLRGTVMEGYYTKNSFVMYKGTKAEIDAMPPEDKALYLATDENTLYRYHNGTLTSIKVNYDNINATVDAE